jgi:hypothetical protein
MQGSIGKDVANTRDRIRMGSEKPNRQRIPKSVSQTVGLKAIPVPPDLSPSPEPTNGVLGALSGEILIAIPPSLLEAISAEKRLASAREDISAIESQLTASCSTHHIGVWHGRTISSPTLLPNLPFPTITSEIAKAMGWDENEAKLAHQTRLAAPRAAHFSQVARGFAGWLLTNRQFLEEHDALFRRWREQIRDRATRNQWNLLAELGMTRATEADTADNEFDAEVVKFLVRWRLHKMSGPELPEPLRPMMSGQFPVSVVQQLLDAGGLFNIPDTFPIPSRDELRGILQDALRPGDDASHLAEWHKVVHGQNMAKNQIVRFARIRQVYTFWRCLHQRHGASLRRKTQPLQRAFAKFLKVSEASLKSDLSLIARRLGKNWLERQAVG